MSDVIVTGDDLQRRLLEVFCEVLRIETPSDAEDISRRNNEDWDSFNHLRLAVELEEALGIELDEEAWAEVTSLREAESLVCRHPLKNLRAAERTAESSE